jgi:hypothetical protein
MGMACLVYVWVVWEKNFTLMLGKKKKENPKAGTATNDHINYPLNSNHNLVSG